MSPEEFGALLRRSPGAVLTVIDALCERARRTHAASAAGKNHGDSNGVPTFNTDRSQTVASLDRVKKIAEKLKATVIIQHDTRHIDRLPAWPNAAR